MRRELSREQWLSSINPPWRRFKAFVRSSSGRFRLREPVGLPSYWFEAHDTYQYEDRSFRDPDNPSVHLVVDGKVSVFFYLTDMRLDSCTFAFDLTPRHLDAAVLALKRAKLHRFIVPAAQYALAHLPEDRRPVLADALRALVTSRRGRPRPKDVAPPPRTKLTRFRSICVARPLLDLSGRDLTALPARALASARVKSLALSGNRLRALPDAVATLSALEELDIPRIGS